MQCGDQQSPSLCRSFVEAVAIAAGRLLGGQVGVGMVTATVDIGALINLNFRMLCFDASAVVQENLETT